MSFEHGYPVLQTLNVLLLLAAALARRLAILEQPDLALLGLLLRHAAAGAVAAAGARVLHDDDLAGHEELAVLAGVVEYGAGAGGGAGRRHRDGRQAVHVLALTRQLEVRGAAGRLVRQHRLVMVAGAGHRYRVRQQVAVDVRVAVRAGRLDFGEDVGGGRSQAVLQQLLPAAGVVREQLVVALRFVVVARRKAVIVGGAARLHHHLQRLQAALRRLDDRVGLADQNHVALGEDGGLEAAGGALDDRLLVGLDDRLDAGDGDALGPGAGLQRVRFVVSVLLDHAVHILRHTVGN